MTAPMMSPTTIPPAAMLSKKFLSDGVTLSAASATSGTIMEAVKAAAVSPVTAFSFSDDEAFTSSLVFGLAAVDDGEPPAFLAGRRGRGLKNEFDEGMTSFFWEAKAGGMIAMETAEVEAIDLQTRVFFFFFR